MKFFFGLLAFIAAIVVVVLLVVSLFRGFNGGSSRTSISSTFSLEDKTAIDSVVRYTVSGPVVADENYRQVTITISKNARTIEVLHGYAERVEKTTTIANTPEAYSAFLGALRAAEFTNKREGVVQDPASTCVTGSTLSYELSSASERKVDTWATSCSNRDGNYGGNIPGTAQIFRAQIPDYRKFVSGVNIPSL